MSTSPLPHRPLSLPPPLPLPTPGFGPASPDAAAVPGLPADLTPLIGREEEQARLVALIRGGARLVTLTGPGGVGKTRLAIAAARALSEQGGLPADFVSLAALADPALVADGIVRALGLREDPEQPPFAALAAALGRRPRLLVLDNFEHLLGAAPLAHELLAVCPELRLLVTSRGRLHIGGEQTVPVPPLPVPASGPPTADLPANPAVRLFAERARAAAPGFALTADNAAAVAAICRGLDGLPLAIELAAARVRILPPAALLARLGDHGLGLDDGPRDAPPRHRSVRAAIAWSYDLLGPAERTLLQRLSLFPAGFGFEAAEAMGRLPRTGAHVPGAGGDPAPAPPDSALPVLDLLGALIDAGLVQRVAGDDVDGRFAMLETVRRFAREELAAGGDEPASEEAQAAYLLALVEAATADARLGATATTGRDRINAELGNLRPVLTWFQARGDGAGALRFVAALAPFWLEHGPYGEGRAALEQALALAGGTARARVAAQIALARLVCLQGEFPRAVVLGEAGLALARAEGEGRSAARALLVIGEATGRGGDPAGAARRLEDGLALFRELGDRRGMAETLGQLAVVAWMRGDEARFAALAEEALPLWRAVGDRAGVMSALDALSLAASQRGDHRRQAELASEMLALSAEVGTPYAVASALWTAAAIAGDQGQPRTAARLYGAEEALREATGFVLDPAFGDDYRRGVEAVRAALGLPAFAAAWAAGRALAPAQAVAEARAALDGLAAAEPRTSVGRGVARAPVAAHALTRREGEVLRLLAQGHSDKEIAAGLAISRPTASRHVATILAKLGAPSRAAAAAFAVREGLA